MEILSIIRYPHSLFVAEIATFQSLDPDVMRRLAVGRIDAKTSGSTRFPAMTAKYWFENSALVNMR